MSQAVVLQKSDPMVKGACLRLNMQEPSAASLAVGTAIDLQFPPEKIWAVLEDLEGWRKWSRPFHSGARWLEGRSFEVGARFEQIRHLGFPIGKQVTVETVREVIPGQSVAWWDGNGGVRNAHVWAFESRPDGVTRVYNVEVLCGPLVFFAKPILGRRLRKRFRQSLEGLKAALERQQPA